MGFSVIPSYLDHIVNWAQQHQLPDPFSELHHFLATLETNYLE